MGGVTRTEAAGPAWQPALAADVTGPGTAPTTRLSSSARRAVLSDPERSPASTTTVAALRIAAWDREVDHDRTGQGRHPQEAVGAGDPHRRPGAVRPLVDAHQRDERETGACVGHPPEVALHRDSGVRAAGILPRQVGAGAAVAPEQVHPPTVLVAVTARAGAIRTLRNEAPLDPGNLGW